MIKLIISFFILINMDCAFAQTKKMNLSDSTSNIINILSYFWIKDSLANNGFRLYSYNHILKSKKDNVTLELLKEKLGKPNDVKITNKGTEYIYFVFDSKAMPANYGKPFECIAIYFMFQQNNNILSEIGEIVFDY
jgi:hypothetical protein